MNDATLSPVGTVDILLVEDNPRDAELTLRELKKHNLPNRLVWVKNGAAALDFFFGAPTGPPVSPNPAPGLVLLDLKLPKVDGHEVLRRLKEDSRTRAIPVVVLTSSHEEMDILRSYQMGVNSYIVKPLEFDKFTEAIRQLRLYWLPLNQASHYHSSTQIGCPCPPKRDGFPLEARGNDVLG